MNIANIKLECMGSFLGKRDYTLLTNLGLSVKLCGLNVDGIDVNLMVDDTDPSITENGIVYDLTFDDHFPETDQETLTSLEFNEVSGMVVILNSEPFDLNEFNLVISKPSGKEKTPIEIF